MSRGAVLAKKKKGGKGTILQKVRRRRIAARTREAAGEKGGGFGAKLSPIVVQTRLTCDLHRRPMHSTPGLHVSREGLRSNVVKIANA